MTIPKEVSTIIDRIDTVILEEIAPLDYFQFKEKFKSTKSIQNGIKNVQLKAYITIENKINLNLTWQKDFNSKPMYFNLGNYESERLKNELGDRLEKNKNPEALDYQEVCQLCKKLNGYSEVKIKEIHAALGTMLSREKLEKYENIPLWKDSEFELKAESNPQPVEGSNPEEDSYQKVVKSVSPYTRFALLMQEYDEAKQNLEEIKADIDKFKQENPSVVSNITDQLNAF